MQINLGTPQPKQREFLKAKTRFVAYGGARGGGKSWTVRFKAKLLALRYDGIRILLLRRTFPELQENHILPLLKELVGIATYNDSKKVFTFPNGSRIKLGYCDNDRSVDQYQGQEYDVIFMDEATHFTEYQFRSITAIIRGANAFPKRFYLTCNPGGVGHAWVKRLFIDREYKENERPEDYTFIQATVHDNKILLSEDPGYLQMLLSQPDGQREAWLNGNWDIFAGQFFTEFLREVHVVEPEPIEFDCVRVYRVFDYGLDMLACLWVYVDRYGAATVYRELHEKNLVVSEAAAKILAMTTSEEQVYETLAPPDMWSRQKDSGKSMADLFFENGLNIIRSPNERVSGWMNVKEYLKIQGEGENRRSKLRIFSSCSTLIKHLPLLQYDKLNPGDAATEPHEITHICDALRYFCAAHTANARVKEEKSPEQLWKEKRIRQVRARNKR